MPEIQFESITSPFASGEIVLLDMQPKGSYSFQDILSHPDLVNYSGPIFAADFAISSSPEVSEDMLMEGGMLLATRYTGIYNGQVRSINQIDHHDPHPSHQQNISATNLAIEYVRRFGYPNGKIVLSHYDCDSVCAAWILSGKIDPMYFPRIWYAAIAADHTGDRDMIADILQGLSDISSNVYKTGKPIGNMHTPDPAISFSILPHLLRGEAIEMLPAVVQEALAYRDRQRRRIEYYVSRIESDGTIRDEQGEIAGTYQEAGNGVAVMYVTGKKIPAELLIPLFPEATIILEVSQNPVFPGTMQIHFRAGRKFPKGGSFVNLDLRRFHMGGRWDAGGSSRQIEEERLVDPSEIALYMATHIEDLVQNRENE